MSIRNVLASKINPRKLSNRVNIPTSMRWERNKAWPVLTEPLSSEQKLVGLYAVFPADGTGTGNNWFAVTFQGAYTVDFGDGTSVNTNSNVATQKSYDFNNVNLYDATVTFTDTGDLVTRNSHGYVNGDSVKFYRIVSTTGISEGQVYYVINATTNTFQISQTVGGSAVALTTNGSASLLPYKIATVTITPQAGQNLTTVTLSTKYSVVTTQSYSTGWLDIALSAPNATSISISSANQQRNGLLERFNLIASGAFPSCVSWFQNAFSLQEVIIPFNATASVTSTGSMFSGCSSLTSVPLFTTAAVTNMSSMFAGCSTLVTVPLFNTASATTMANMFANCRSLIRVPLFNTSSVTTFANTFQNCSALQSIPWFDTSSATTMSFMLAGCSSLVSVPHFDTSSATNLQDFLSNCTALEEVPLFDISSATNLRAFLLNCSSLTSVPLFDTSSALDLTSFLGNCTSLEAVPLFNTSSATNMTDFLPGCTRLTSIPLFNTSAATNVTRFLSGCVNLSSVPALDFSSVTSSANLGLMFSGDTSLARIQATGFKFTFSVASCNLSSTALNEIYTNLPTVTGQTITVTGNYGTAGDNPAIATAKGWTVVG